MNITFWGARGSIPTPLTPRQYRSRIAAIVQRIQTTDLSSQQSREQFISLLPKNLKQLSGGNTTCVQVSSEGGNSIIIDAGSGLRELAVSLQKKEINKGIFHIFFTHFHWDHIQGLPFFTPYLYHPDSQFHFYHPDDGINTILKAQMNRPYFPIELPSDPKRFHYHKIPAQGLELGDFKIRFRHMKHPGGSISYKIESDNSSFIFSTDTELSELNFIKNEENRLFYYKSNLLVMDSQYTLDEAMEKYDWGHTSYSLAVDFANSWEIERLGLFHHDPVYSDTKLARIEKSAIQYNRRSKSSLVEIFSAMEGMEVII